MACLVSDCSVGHDASVKRKKSCKNEHRYTFALELHETKDYVNRLDTKNAAILKKIALGRCPSSES